MAIDGDEEILQDFLVKAEEILEQLGQQLVGLEKEAANKDLLKSVFRGFHIIKGGAKFINIASLITNCRRAKDIFNLLRQEQRRVVAGLVNTILRVVDSVKSIIDHLRRSEITERAVPSLTTFPETLSATNPSGTASNESRQQPNRA